jgi:DNA segregation ATPase FtsK/SpoIIIE, S-DNA-T family
LPNLWIPPLQEKIFLEGLLKSVLPNQGWNGKIWRHDSSWIAPFIGLLDDPEKQLQYPLTIDFAKEGSISIFGGPGAGKTTFLQTVITSLILMHDPEDLNIYIMDFGSGILNVFSSLPHVGGFITVDEKNKLKKLMRFIFKEIDNRKALFTSQGVGNFNAYRQSIKKNIPAIFIIIDNFAAVSELYPDVHEQFVQISREGQNLGIYLVLAANNMLDIGYKIGNNINMAVAIQMPDKGAYLDIVGSPFNILPESVKGRGLIKSSKPLEFQTALPIKGETEAERTLNIRKLSEEMKQNWKGKTARQIPIMPETVLYDELLKNIAKDIKNQLAVPIGLDFDDLEVQYLDLNNTFHFLIAGKPQSGKSNFLKIILKYFTGNYYNQKVDIYIIDSFSKGEFFEFKDIGKIKFYSDHPKTVNIAISKIITEIESRKKLSTKEIKKSGIKKSENEIYLKFPPIILIIDDYKEFLDSLDEDKKSYIANIITRERLSGFHMIISGLFDDVNYSYDSIIKSLKSSQNGLLFSELSDQQIFNIRVKYSDSTEELLPGEGYITRNRSFVKIKTALIE